MAGLYIHIPFCRSRCSYCDFFSTTSLERRGDYVRALIAETERARGFLKGRPLETIYLGGGTPSLLSQKMLEDIFLAVARLWDMDGVTEITLEANPDDLDTAYLAAIRVLPVNRLSLGVQSFDDGLLRFMNRRHTSAAARDAVTRAREVGFGNISIDLIYGIPGMSPAQWSDTVERALELRPEHISAYHLTIEPLTAFGRRNLMPVAEDVGEAHYFTLCEKLSEAGYEHYELSNFSLPGYRARHNSSYWRGEPYLGIGAGAHSYDGERMRRWIDQPLEQYMSVPCYKEEILTDDDLYNEYVMTRLRTSGGVSLPDLESRFGADRAGEFAAICAKWIRGGEMFAADGLYRMSPRHFLVSDSVISSLFV